MAVKVNVKYSRTGATGKKAISDFKKDVTSVGKAVQKGVPRNFPAVIANKVRGYFSENFNAQYLWQKPNFTQKQAYKKNMWRNRGDYFRIGGLGILPVVHGAEVFGRLTDAVHDAIGTRQGTIVRSERREIKGGMSLKIHTAIDNSSWEGGSTHIYKTRRGDVTEHDTNVRNAFNAFANRVTKGGFKEDGSNTAVFVKISRAQRKDLILYILRAFGRVVKEFRYGGI